MVIILSHTLDSLLGLFGGGWNGVPTQLQSLQCWLLQDLTHPKWGSAVYPATIFAMLPEVLW